MKKLIFAAMLSVSSIALAQTEGPTTAEPADAEAMQAEPMAPEPAADPAMPAEQMAQPEQPMPAPQPMEQPSGQTVDDPSQSTGPRGVTQQGTDPNGMATPPEGTNMAAPPGPAEPMANQDAAFTPRPAAGEYPACSRTVTDSCVQTYEKGRRPRR